MEASTRESAISYRPLTRREDCEAVVALEREIWGPNYDEAVPVALLLVTQARGGILLGAFDRFDRLIGFVYSLSAIKDGRPMQWSYKLGVLDAFRQDGVGEQLKRHQRQRALDMGFELIEWTFDPMLAANAHLNLTKLGAVVREYHADLYGRSLSPVAYRNIPSDRFVASWQLRDAAVPPRTHGSLLPADADDLPIVNRTTTAGVWPVCDELSFDLDAPRLAVQIPLRFGDMVLAAPDLALGWRLALRRIFSTYFANGYSAIEFRIDPPRQRGVYLLVNPEAAALEVTPGGSHAHHLHIVRTASPDRP